MPTFAAPRNPVQPLPQARMNVVNPRQSQPVAHQPAPSRPTTIRGQMPDEPRPRPAPAPTPIPFRMPAPEELGLAASSLPGMPTPDWAEVHRRLHALGATGLQLDPLAAGGWRVTFTLPTGQENKAQRVQAHAESPESAVRMALAEADAWRTQARK